MHPIIYKCVGIQLSSQKIYINGSDCSKGCQRIQSPVKKLYGNQLVELILFGSHARGNFNSESDVDFAVVPSSPEMHPAVEILKTAPLALQLELKYGWMLSTLPVSPDKKEAAMKGVYQDIRKERIVI